MTPDIQKTIFKERLDGQVITLLWSELQLRDGSRELQLTDGDSTSSISKG